MIDTNIVNGEFNFIKSISDLYKELVAKFNGKSELDLNASIVEIGRTEEEKGQLQEMCDDIDSYHRRIKQLRESGLTPGKWLEKEIENELEKVDPQVSYESKEEFKKFILDQFGKEIGAQADALDEELNQTVNITEGGIL